ncbi:Pentatricopeptide repeat [Dillenia turbinata]|uniref:Pentatricopeptide repeat n=1 Tax=Dillenia turbinata TaxID=194707 RepID=A0AAN8VIU0_9MAGN
MNGTSKAVFSKSMLLKPEASHCESLLRHFAFTKSLANTEQLHAFAITSGLFSSCNNILSNLAVTYARCGSAQYARRLFDKMPKRSLFAWNTMLKMYSQKGVPNEVVEMFIDMMRWGDHRPDNFTYPFVIKACGELSMIQMGILVHGLTAKSGFLLNMLVQNCLLAMYMNCREQLRARQVFDDMEKRSVVSWNTMINGYFRNGCFEQALRFFELMMESGEKPDCATIVSVLPVCGHLENLGLGRQIHAMVEALGFGDIMEIRNCLIDMYAKCGSMDEAKFVFDKMDVRDVVTWTSMINGFIWNTDAQKALALCPLMQFDRVRLNSVTVSSLIVACASISDVKIGKCLHGWAIRQNYEDDVNIETALINMYAKCSRADFGFQVFMKTSQNGTALWSAILSGYIHNGMTREAIELFKEMLLKEVDPNIVTMKSLLPAYAILADLQQAQNVHGYITQSGFLSRTEIVTVMVDIYSKCGNLESAHKIFNSIPVMEKDIVSWSVIIAGYGMHGHGQAAVTLFNEMVLSGVKPNDVTFTSVLNACSHAGLVDEGLILFRFMLDKSQICMRMDHYTCMVDLLGRAGRLDEAYELIRTMPIEPTHAVWGALLGACVIHENVKYGEVAAQRLFELEPHNTGNYILMAKIYAAVGRLDVLEQRICSQDEALRILMLFGTGEWWMCKVGGLEVIISLAFLTLITCIFWRVEYFTCNCKLKFVTAMHLKSVVHLGFNSKNKAPQDQPHIPYFLNPCLQFSATSHVLPLAFFFQSGLCSSEGPLIVEGQRDSMVERVAFLSWFK